MRATSLLAALALAGCSTTPVTTTASAPTTSETSPTSQAVETTTTLPALIGALPEGPCLLGPLASGGEVTFAVGNQLFGAGADGSAVRCLLEVDEQITSVLWSPTGERVAINGKVNPEDPTIAPVPWIGEWTRPTGQGLLSLDERGALFKHKDGDVLEVSFLADHDAAAYHPAGTHIAAIGTHEDGRYGLWMATNLGDDPVLLATDEEAVLNEVEFDAAGNPLFVARHGEGQWHLHRLVPTETEIVDQLLVEAADPIGGLAPSPFLESLVAYRVGGDPADSCVPGGNVEVLGVTDPGPVSLEQGTAAGWLPDDQLLVLRYPTGCISADLYVYSTGLCPGAPHGLALLAEKVMLAAARIVNPPPPPPPGSGVIDSMAPA